MNCEFCSNQELMRDGTKVNKELDVILEEHLLEHGDSYHMFHLSGGEPTIDVKQLENILSVLLSHSLDKPIQLYTNGSYLTPTMVEVFNQYPNIFVNISIDRLLDGERGLFKLLDKDYRGGYGSIKLIQQIKNKTIRVVAPRELFKEFSLALELSMLYQFFQCPVLIDFDWRDENLNQINLDDAYNVGELIFRLSELDVYEDGKISFNKFFTSSCTSECGNVLKWDGTIFSGCQLESSSGCEKLRKKMIPGMYDLLSQFINYQSYSFDTKLEDLPTYDASVGFVGERKELIPQRKQLQYEDRVNYRYRKNEQILFKEVS